MLEVSALNAWYGESHILHGVDFEVREGRTILMVEHNLSVVEGLCDIITVLTRGKVLAEGDYATVSKNPEVIAAYLGSSDA